MINKYKLIKIEIPEDTTKKMLKKKWLRNAVGCIADVITWMQEDIEKWLNINEWKKNNKSL
jgi:hypothetical protein